MAQTIVVLGGSFAGIQIAHRLVKNTRKSVKDLKVILVSKVSDSVGLALVVFTARAAA
jgi:NADH dehydrogenase FAD-containing subunit